MIIRSAYLEGTVASAEREAFDAHMSGPVLAAIATYPGLRQVRLRKLALADAGAPPIYMVFDLYFDSLQAMDAALASPTRQAVRDLIAQGMTPFQGRVYHLVFSEEGGLLASPA
ncbi:MAG: EthD family reductase [Betaproteobacteria bacterium]|nr:EthD family reductase [Betaproteobacteria bacterium]